MKPTVPQRQGSILNLESVAPDDQTLPKPPGRLPHRRKATTREIADTARKLEKTKRFGGLLPEFYHPPHWACPDCGRVYTNRNDAYLCHRVGANKIQICPTRQRRLSDCTCP